LGGTDEEDRRPPQKGSIRSARTAVARPDLFTGATARSSCRQQSAATHRRLSCQQSISSTLSTAVVVALSPPRLLLMVKIRQPSHEFTFGVGISFIPYPSVLTPVV
jgi:hypothetical protein